VTTVLQGIKDKLGTSVEVFYSRATNFVDTIQQDFSNLIDSVKDADVLIYVGGISPRLEGEEMRVSQRGFSGGDRTTIALPSVQTDFLKALKATGKPVVFVMMTGSAIAIRWEAENIPAIMNAWYGGQAGGSAVADVLFGDYNPSGRLPVTFYRNDEDLPAFEDYAMVNRTYRYFKGEVLYPFGFGLSYTNFKYSNLKLSKASVKKNESLQAEVTITNTGKYKGDEVVQLYVSHQGVVFAPLAALKNFKRITVAPGASQKVTFNIAPDLLTLVNTNGAAVFIPGKTKIIISGCSPVKQAEKLGISTASEAVLTLK
jgi:beta-glucosidase